MQMTVPIHLAPGPKFPNTYQSVWEQLDIYKI